MDRIQLRLALACAALLGLAACGDDDMPMIMFPDSGMADAGTDAGGGGEPDAGGGVCGTISATETGFPALPGTCLPRCTRATLDTILDCPEETAIECQNAALASDTMTAATLAIGTDTEELNCNLCFNWQINSCVFDACPSEFQAWATCRNGGGECTTEEGALDACIGTNMTAVQTCAFGSETTLGRAVMCFDVGGTAGFLPFASTVPNIRLTAAQVRAVIDPSFVR